MAMTEEERFRFDLTGFLVRPAILSPPKSPLSSIRSTASNTTPNRCRPSTATCPAARPVY